MEHKETEISILLIKTYYTIVHTVELIGTEDKLFQQHRYATKKKTIRLSLTRAPDHCMITMMSQSLYKLRWSELAPVLNSARSLSRETKSTNITQPQGSIIMNIPKELGVLLTRVYEAWPHSNVYCRACHLVCLFNHCS